MLRLVALADDPDETVLVAEGWIQGDNVALLHREIVERMEAHTQLVLDLAGVRFIDPAGLDLLARWAAQGLALRGGSLFIRALLARRGLRCAEGG